ncbi:hypothetical protein [Alistipes indistinctus]|uniref:hypothetical protein n=1 Tax=Alistipes indistinctus TaxID=626932 RepID=UPI003F11C89E
MSLKSDYINACNAYLKAFCEMYGFDYYPDFCIGDEVGGVIELGDYFVNINTIRTAVDKGVPREEFVKWYDYCMDCGSLGIPSPNFDSWLRGCPRMSDEKIRELMERHHKIEELKEELRKLIEEKRSEF